MKEFDGETTIALQNVKINDLYDIKYLTLQRPTNVVINPKIPEAEKYIIELDVIIILNNTLIF